MGFVPCETNRLGPSPVPAVNTDQGFENARDRSENGPEPKYALAVGVSALRVNLTKVRTAFDRRVDPEPT